MDRAILAMRQALEDFCHSPQNTKHGDVSLAVVRYFFEAGWRYGIEECLSRAEADGAITPPAIRALLPGPKGG